MKYRKIEYTITGRFPEGNKYGIVTRDEVAGYTADELQGVAIRKHNGFWYVDHIQTGLGVVTVGCSTRDKAAQNYAENYKAMLDSKPADYFKKAVEAYAAAPLESEVAAWECVNFCTVSSWKFDRVTEAARRAGLIVKSADEATYQHGGNVDIIGAADKLQEVRDMIRKLEKAEPETVQEAQEAPAADGQKAEPEKVQAEQTAQAEEPAAAFVFAADSIACKGKTFPAEYNITSAGAVLIFVITGTRENGRKQKQKIVVQPDETEYPAALAAAKAAGASAPVKAAAYLPPLEDEEPEETEALAACEIVKAEAAPEAQETPETAQDPQEAPQEPTPEAEPAQDDARRARGPVPEKSFVGQTIQGEGWRIYFDGDAARTRVIFDKVPPAAAKEAVKEAGFYYSGAMRSWNKKLTFKAYRAALVLSDRLRQVYAA